jgi:hypothetical protein
MESPCPSHRYSVFFVEFSPLHGQLIAMSSGLRDYSFRPCIALEPQLVEFFAELPHREYVRRPKDVGLRKLDEFSNVLDSPLVQSNHFVNLGGPFPHVRISDPGVGIVLKNLLTKEAGKLDAFPRRLQTGQVPLVRSEGFGRRGVS